MKFTEKNIYAGKTQPQAVIETPYSKTTNEGIWNKEIKGESSVYTYWYVMQATHELYEDKIKASFDELDELIASIIEGTVDTTLGGQLYARLIHEGKRTYPSEIPANLLQKTYDAYTNIYKFQPPLTPPNEE